jgi:hypothetical protein
MKTSNIFLLTALIVLAFSLGAYNMALKSEYTSEAYKDPLRYHKLLAFTGFNEIDVNAAHMLSVKIEHGEEHQVYLQDLAFELIQVTQDGKRLKIDITTEEERFKGVNRQGPFHIVIKTPHVSVIRTNALHSQKGTQYTRAEQPQFPDYYGVTAEGLQQDKLVVEVDNGSNLLLRGNKLEQLQATAGRGNRSQSKLQLMPNNQIQQAELDMRNSSHLVMHHVAIPQLRYTFSDSVQVNVSGVSLAVLRK